MHRRLGPLVVALLGADWIVKVLISTMEGGLWGGNFQRVCVPGTFMGQEIDFQGKQEFCAERPHWCPKEHFIWRSACSAGYC